MKKFKMLLFPLVLVAIAVAGFGVYHEYQIMMVPKIKEFKVTKNGETSLFPVATVDNTKVGQCLVKYSACTTDPDATSCYPYARVAKIKEIGYDVYMLAYYYGDPDKKKIGQIAEVPRHYVEAVSATPPEDYFTIQDCYLLTLENAPGLIPSDKPTTKSKTVSKDKSS
jgi:hypothetical protein